MPKVSKDYINNKKNSIIEAACLVCKNKPLYEVTMKDIIKQSGVSQGGIYRYFNDIDDVIIELVNKSYSNLDYKKDIDSIIEDKEDFRNKIESLFEFLSNYMKENIMTTGKIQFELTILLANQQNRRSKIMKSITEMENSQYLIDQLFKVIKNGALMECFKPVVPIKDIYTFIITSLDGILRDIILSKCYEPLEVNNLEFDEDALIKTLSKSVLLMLGCN